MIFVLRITARRILASSTTPIWVGVVRWEQGVDGRSVRVERTVRDAAGKVVIRDSFVSRYQPLDWLKRVGT